MEYTDKEKEEPASTGRLKKSKSVYKQAVILLLSLIAVLLIFNISLVYKKGEKNGGWERGKLREYAGKLKANGMLDESAEAFEEYLKSGKIDDRTRSNIYYSLGEGFFNKSEYEKALGYLLKAETANPDTKMKKEIGSYMVTCMEKLGKPLDAEYQLESRSLLSGEAKSQKAPGEVVAMIGKRRITTEEINAKIDALPVKLREEYMKSEEKKLEFLKQYVAGELLYRKGVKLGFDKDKDIRAKVDDIMRQLVIRKVMEKETAGKVRVDRSDLKNYYIANKERYTGRRLRFKHILLKSKKEAERVKKELAGGADFARIAVEKSIDPLSSEKGGEIAGWVYPGDKLPEAGGDISFTKALFKLKDGAKNMVVKSAAGFHVVSIIKKERGKERKFNNIMDEVKADYSSEKSGELMQKLLSDSVKSNKVVIFDKKFRSEGK